MILTTIILINIVYLILYLNERSFKQDYKKFDKQMEREGIWIGKSIKNNREYEIIDIYYSKYKNETIVNFRIQDVIKPTKKYIIDYDTLKTYKLC